MGGGLHSSNLIMYLVESKPGFLKNLSSESMTWSGFQGWGSRECCLQVAAKNHCLVWSGSVVWPSSSSQYTQILGKPWGFSTWAKWKGRGEKLLVGTWGSIGSHLVALYALCTWEKLRTENSRVMCVIPSPFLGGTPCQEWVQPFKSVIYSDRGKGVLYLSAGTGSIPSHTPWREKGVQLEEKGNLEWLNGSQERGGGRLPGLRLLPPSHFSMDAQS